MMTLEQFRRTGVYVADITDYNGADNDQGRGRPGRIYMDGTLNIERVGDGWVLTIGSQQYDYDAYAPLEEILYDWAKDEYGEMFDTEYRIPPCPINPTEAQMREWFEEMHKRGLSYHPDDDPADVIYDLGGYRVFYDNEVEALRSIMRDLFRLHGDRVHQVANEVVGVTTGDEG